MKKTLLAAALLLGAQQAYAAPCTAGSLADYIGLASGCEIGAHTFTDFTSLPVLTGATEIPASSIGVVPVTGGPSAFGLDFQVSQTANAGEFFGFLLGYRVLGSGISGVSVLIDDSLVTPDGGVSAIKDICRSGVFSDFAGSGPASCDGALGPSLLALDLGFDAQLLDQQSFAAVSSLSVVDDVVIDGGLSGGSASLGVVGNRFVAAAVETPVPAPGTALLVGLGLACIRVASGRWGRFKIREIR